MSKKHIARKCTHHLLDIHPESPAPMRFWRSEAGFRPQVCTFKKWGERPSPHAVNILTGRQVSWANPEVNHNHSRARDVGTEEWLEKSTSFLYILPPQHNWTSVWLEEPSHLYHDFGLCCQLPMMANKPATENEDAHLYGACHHPSFPFNKTFAFGGEESKSTLHFIWDHHCGGRGTATGWKCHSIAIKNTHLYLLQNRTYVHHIYVSHKHSSAILY